MVDAEGVLRRVTVRLPPPPPRSASRLPRSVRRAFSRLFEALGLQNCFEGDEELDLDRTKVRSVAPQVAVMHPVRMYDTGFTNKCEQCCFSIPQVMCAFSPASSAS